MRSQINRHNFPSRFKIKPRLFSDFFRHFNFPQVNYFSLEISSPKNNTFTDIFSIFLPSHKNKKDFQNISSFDNEFFFSFIILDLV